MKNHLILLFAILLTGCATTQITSVPTNTANDIKKVCIEHNAKVIVKNFDDILRNRLEDHGITSLIYNKDQKPNDCKYTLRYVAYQKWDMTMVMTHAELRLYKDDIKIGYAEYHLPAGGLLNPKKYISNESKINPLIDQLLGK